MIDASLQLLRDQDRRRNMARAARERAQRFSWPRVTEQMVDLYARVAESMPP